MTKSGSAVARWSSILLVILLAWGLRLAWLAQVPPGWRDDELINIYTLSSEPLAGHFPLYFTAASGHEPLYHYLHAGLLALLGHNALSGHLLSIILGTLTIPLVYALARRLFGWKVATLGALSLALSFWSLMYSRIGLRHISLLPFALTVFYLMYRPLIAPPRPTLRWALPLGLLLGASLYTYTAARLLPPLLVVFGLYLALFHRPRFRRVGVGYAMALAVAMLLVTPLAVAIVRGHSAAAAAGVGADARLVELAQPIRELAAGNPRPLLENVWTTLGMFHVTGDPEWLYNISGRPVLNLLGGALFWLGALACLLRYRRPRRFLLLLWLGFGLLPTMLSIPAASLSHSILVQPLASLLPLLTITWAYRSLSARLRSHRWASAARPLLLALLTLFLATTCSRDLGDYFRHWPQHGLVRFLYRADYREAARYLDGQAGSADWAVGSLLMGPWDRLALQVDTGRDDLSMRLFDPQRALVIAASSSPAVLLTSYPEPSPLIARLLQENGRPLPGVPSPLTGYAMRPAEFPAAAEPLARFGDGLELVSAEWDIIPAPDREGRLVTTWRVAGPLHLPPLPVVANPPPPGVYAGPRLSVFAHLLAADSTLLAGDDGLWVDPLTLEPGDCFIQIHRFALGADAPPQPYTLELGLYDPLDGARWDVLDGAGQPISDHVLLPVATSEPDD